MDLVELSKKLISYQSNHKNSEELKACLDFCSEFFEDTGLLQKRYLSKGVESLVILTHDTIEPNVLLLGHIDVIPAPAEYFSPRVEDDRLYGIGSLDMKAFVATSMILMREIQDINPDLKIALAIVTDEESGGHNGTQYLAETIGYKPGVVLVPDDGEDINNLVVETKHILQVRLVSKGKASHACQPWYGSNAIDTLINAYTKFKQMLPENINIQPDQGEWVSTVNVGVIKGGIAINEVPDNASIDIDIRLVFPMTKQDILNILDTVTSENVTYEIISEGYPTNLDINNPIIKTYYDSITSVIGSKANLFKSGGGTDGRYFSALGIPVIVHQGAGGNCQSYDEYISISSQKQLLDIQKNFLKNLKL